MNIRRSTCSLVVLSALVAVAAAGCATGHKMSPTAAVAERQRLMKLNGASWQDVQAKVKAGNIDAVAVNAETMAVTARHIPNLFPEGSLTADSKAKPEVWQKWAEFEQAAKAMQMESEKLRDAARAKNKAQVEAIVKDFGRNACGACHTPFRVPPRS